MQAKTDDLYDELGVSDNETGRSPVGVLLKKTRRKFGYDLGEISAYLNIRKGLLVAIEEGNFHELPGTVYALGFIKSYADYLGLDPDLVANRFKQEVGAVQPKVELDMPVRSVESRIPDKRVIIAASVILVVITLISYFVFSGGDQQETMLQTPEVEAVFGDDVIDTSDIVTMRESTQNEAVGEMASLLTNPSATLEADVTTVSPQEQTQPSPQPETTQNSQAQQTTQSSQTTQTFTPSSNDAAVAPNARQRNDLLSVEDRGNVYGSQNRDSRIAIKSSSNSWVEIRNDKNTIMLSRVLKEGDVYYVPAVGNYFLTTGNAGGLEMYVDKKFAGFAGTSGEVLKNYKITLNGLVKQ